MYIKIKNEKSGYTYNEPVYGPIQFTFSEDYKIAIALFRGRSKRQKIIPIAWIVEIAE